MFIQPIRSGTQNSPTHTYLDTQGTSFSSPIIAGAAALWKEKYPDGTPLQFFKPTTIECGRYWLLLQIK